MAFLASGRSLVALLALAAAAAPSASAQIVLFEVYGQQDGDSLGMLFDGAGDVDADGYADLVVSRAKGLGPDQVYYGYVTVYSGLDNSVIWQVETPFGSVAGAGDVDADGYDDIVVGGPGYDLVGQNSGIVQVYSGADASLLYQFFGDANELVLGRIVSRIGDTNGDGYPDILAGAPNGGSSGRVYIWSGVDGSNLLTLQLEGGAGGDSLDGAGDVDGDGAGDFIIGFSSSSVKEVRVYSGATGDVLFTFGYPSSQALGWGSAVAGAGDVDADGHADLLAGAWGDSTLYSQGGSARLYSGADGSEMRVFYGWGPHEFMGSAVDGAGDVNGDGTLDLLVGSPGSTNPVGHASSGQLLIYSGSDGALIRNVSPAWYEANDNLGRAVKGVGDLNGDGFDDFGGGAPDNDVGGISAGTLLIASLRHFITDIEPDEAIFSKPTQVSIIGGGFTPAEPISVEFGGLPATDVTYVSPTRIDCTTPVGAEDTLVGASLTQHGLTSADAQMLTFGSARIESLWPPKGSMFGEELVLISGQNFVDDGSVVVTFGMPPLEGTVLEVYEPDAILVRTPFVGADEGMAVKVTSSAGSNDNIIGYGFDDRWIEPKTASIAGGDIITMMGDVFPTTLADTQAWIGGVPAEVVAVTPTGFQIAVPAVDVAPDEWLTVLVHNSNGNHACAGSFHYTPSMDLTTKGNPFVGYDLAGHAGVSSVGHGLPPKLTLWLIDPTTTAPTLAAGRPQPQPSGAGGTVSSTTSPGTSMVAGGGGSLPYSPPNAPAGVLQGAPLEVVLAAVPLNFNYADWAVDIGAIDPTLIGTTLSFQGLVTGDGSPHGALTNVMSFVVQ